VRTWHFSDLTLALSRTSVEMIEKFYAAHIKNRLDASAINVRRPKPTTRKQLSEVYQAPVDPEAQDSV
jgi:hypothetical protein